MKNVMRNNNLNPRGVMFWSVIFALLPLLLGASAWAQEDAPRSSDDSLLPTPIPNFLPDNGDTLIIGREDTDEDGFVDGHDALTIYMQDDDAFVPLELDAEPISEILAMQFTDDGDGVIAVKFADESTGLFVIHADVTTTPIEGLPVLNSPVLQLGSLVVANNSATIYPVTLYVLDDETGDLLLLRELDRYNTTISFDPNFVLAYTADSQLLRIYALDDVMGDPFSLRVDNPIIVPPQWSPAGGMLFYVEADDEGKSVVLLDASTGDTQTISIPNYDDDLQLISDWSNTGRFLCFYALDEDGALTDEPISLVDTQDGTVFLLQSRKTAFVPYAWSADDEYLLYLSQGLDDETEYTYFGVFDAENVSTTNINPGNNQPLALAWHPTEARLAILTEDIDPADQFDVMLYDVETDTLETVGGIDVVDYRSVSMRWLDETDLAIAMTLAEPDDDALNVTYRFNTETGDTHPLIPDTLRLD